MKASTRLSLLAAAEAIVVEQGVNALTVRRIGEAAGLNPTLITYHFGSLNQLLDELCSLNLEPLLAEWRAIEAERTLDGVLRAWLAPMMRPAYFTPGGRALVVLDELAAHGQPGLRSKVLSAMETFAGRLRAALAPLLPELGEHELRARLRFVSGAALGPPPRAHAAPAGDGSRPLDDLSYLLPFARAALGR